MKYLNKPKIIEDEDFQNAKVFTFPVSKKIQEKLYKISNNKINTEIFKDTGYHTYIDTTDGSEFNGENLIVFAAPGINPNYTTKDNNMVTGITNETELQNNTEYKKVTNTEEYETQVIIPYVTSEVEKVLIEFIEIIGEGEVEL